MIKVIITAVFTAVVSIIIAVWVSSYSRLKDSYWFILHTNQAIYELPSEQVEVLKQLNNLLYVNLNQARVSQGYLPSVFRSELDELICSAFKLSNDEKAVYFAKLIKPNLATYIDQHTSECKYKPYA